MAEYYRRETIQAIAPELLEEWDQWLADNFDPGHWEAYKERDQSVLPYVDGHPQWTCEIYMPPHIEAKLPKK